MRASYARRPQEPPRVAQTSMSLIERARLALRQGLANGASLEQLFGCAAETIAVLAGDDVLRRMVRSRAGLSSANDTQKQ